MGPFRATPARVQPYFGYRSRGRLVIGARALRSSKPGFDGGGRWQAMRTMIAQFASREVQELEVTLELACADGTLLHHRQKTDGEGFVRFDLALSPELDLPPHPVWEVVALHWVNSEGPQCVEGHVLVPAADGRLGVISDVDDTIIETGITGGLRSLARNWKRVLAQLPDERLAVPGADAFYGALGGGQSLHEGEAHAGKRLLATRRPFFYVSSSPWNLFSYLVAFKRAKKLPLGPLLLRDWGFNRTTFGSGSHGKHKRDSIEAILAMYPELRFALIGDDTQDDLPAYSEVVERNPQRIAAIFIRTTAGREFSPKENAARAIIELSGVPLWLGDDFKTGQDFLSSVGFTPGGETEQIVRTVEHLEDAPAEQG